MLLWSLHFKCPLTVSLILEFCHGGVALERQRDVVFLEALLLPEYLKCLFDMHIEIGCSKFSGCFKNEIVGNTNEILVTRLSSNISLVPPLSVSDGQNWLFWTKKLHDSKLLTMYGLFQHFVRSCIILTIFLLVQLCKAIQKRTESY